MLFLLAILLVINTADAVLSSTFGAVEAVAWSDKLLPTTGVPAGSLMA